jgi:hypothetical protein
VERLYRAYREAGPAQLTLEEARAPQQPAAPSRASDAVPQPGADALQRLRPDAGARESDRVSRIKVSVETLRQWMTADGIWETS